MKSIITPIHNLYTRSIETQGKCRRELSLSMSITFKIHALAVKYIWPWTTVALCLINTNFWWRNFKTLNKATFQLRKCKQMIKSYNHFYNKQICVQNNIQIELCKVLFFYSFTLIQPNSEKILYCMWTLGGRFT